MPFLSSEVPFFVYQTRVSILFITFFSIRTKNCLLHRNNKTKKQINHLKRHIIILPSVFVSVCVVIPSTWTISIHFLNSIIKTIVQMMHDMMNDSFGDICIFYTFPLDYVRAVQCTCISHFVRQLHQAHSLNHCSTSYKCTIRTYE